MDARRYNDRDGITGALICRQDLYLQLLEGPTQAVTSAADRISRDDRHVEMVRHVSEPITERRFAKWAMLHDPSHTLLWSADDIARGVLDRSDGAEVRKVFDDLAALAKQRTD